MRYTITESKRNDTIETFLKSKFPEVVAVRFSENLVLAYDENGKDEFKRTSIWIVLDTMGITTGGVTAKDMADETTRLIVGKLKRQIYDSLKDWFGINPLEFKSPWSVNLYVLDLKMV